MDKEPHITKTSYVKLFGVKSNVKKAIGLLKEGYSYSEIGKIMGCHRTSVISFHKKINQGYFYRDDPKEEVETEKVNRGKDYRDYLKVYKAQVKDSQKKRMKEAKMTIDKLRKWRKKMHIVEDEVWPF